MSWWLIWGCTLHSSCNLQSRKKEKKRKTGVVQASGLSRRSVCLSELGVCPPAVSKYPTPSLLLGGEGEGGLRARVEKFSLCLWPCYSNFCFWHAGAPCSIHPPPDSSAARTGQQIWRIPLLGQRDKFQFREMSVFFLSDNVKLWFSHDFHTQAAKHTLESVWRSVEPGKYQHNIRKSPCDGDCYKNY